jgi:hypothetical protein
VRERVDEMENEAREKEIRTRHQDALRSDMEAKIASIK